MLTQRNVNFCLDILKEIPAGEAYFAHFKVKSMAVADVCASKLLRTPKIMEKLKELRKQAEDETIADYREVCQVSTAIIRGKVSDFMDEHGQIDKTKLDSHAIQSIEEVRSMAGTTVVTKLRLHNPLDGIEKLAKLKKWYSTEGDEPGKVIQNFLFILPDGTRVLPREMRKEITIGGEDGQEGTGETTETETA